jgi:dolichol-phosphate mannosyltransferase
LTPRFSVVVPVYNEGVHVGEWCRRAVAAFPPGGEVIVVHDFADDDTLPALAALPASQRPEGLRTLLNDTGRGVRGAILSGMRSARAPVVVVSMADLSDDVQKLPEMIARAEAGAAVVAASRYAPGGAQHGGPVVKGMLSRLAGWSLHVLAGLPTRDPTNAFKAYRKDFLDATPVQSEAGFAMALELTVKAHDAGWRVEEVPAQWWDRAAGQSRFRIVAWMPQYLRWWLWAIGRRIARLGSRPPPRASA